MISDSGATVPHTSLRVGGWDVDATAHRISRAGVVRRLEPRVMGVLLRLAEQPGTVVSRQDLLTQVWGDTFVTDDAVSAAVIKLRKAFDDDARAARVVETVPKSGYRLIATVEVDAPSMPASSPQASVEPTVRSASILRVALGAVPRDDAAPDPEDWQQVMTRLQDRLVDLAHSHGGWVLPETSALVAVFGAPLARELHATLAVTTALELRDSKPLRRAPGGLDVTLTMAVVSGDVVASPGVGSVGPSAFGEPMAQAVALTMAGAPGDVVVAGSTRRLLGDRFELAPTANAGASAEEAFRVLGSRSRGESLLGPWRPDLSPFVGRGFELALVDRLLGLAAEGQGQVLAVHGDPGVGKSRLLHETLQRARGQGFRTLSAAASPLDRHSPYFAVQPLLRQAVGARAGDVGVSDPLALTAVLHPGELGDEWSSIDPDVRPARTAALATELLLGDDAVMVAVEDLHWADEASRTLLSALVSRIGRRRCLLVVTYRPELDDPWPAKSYATRLRLDPLAADAAAELLDELTGDDSSLSAWKPRVLDLAEGTPLFLEECVRAAQMQGALVGSPGSYALRPDVMVDVVPTSVRGLLSERIDQLPTSARSALSVAAVIGKECPRSLLHAMLGLDADQRTRVLHQLQDAEVLLEAGSREAPTYAFKHALTQEAAYLGIPASIRREHHRRIAALLTGELAGQVPTTPELLAWHLTQAGANQQALTTWRTAAATAAEAGAYADALAHLDHARALLDSVADPDLRAAESLAIELAAGTALVQTVGPTDEVVAATFERARNLAEQVGTERQRFEAAWGAWFVQMMRGDVTASAGLADEVSALAQDLGDEALVLEGHHVQWSGLLLAGRPAEAREHTAAAIASYRSDDHHWLTYSYGGHDPGVCARNISALASWLLGDVEAARASSADAQALAGRLAHPYTILESTQGALTMALLEHDVAELESLAAALTVLVADGRLPDVAAGFADGFRGAALGFRGDQDAGLAVMRAAAPVWSEFWGAWCFPLDTALAELMATCGHVDAAIEHVERTLAAATQSGAHWWDAELQRVLADLRQRGDL